VREGKLTTKELRSRRAVENKAVTAFDDHDYRPFVCPHSTSLQSPTIALLRFKEFKKILSSELERMLFF
jgi:hypothetical protein